MQISETVERVRRSDSQILPILPARKNGQNAKLNRTPKDEQLHLDPAASYQQNCFVVDPAVLGAPAPKQATGQTNEHKNERANEQTNTRTSERVSERTNQRPKQSKQTDTHSQIKLLQAEPRLLEATCWPTCPAPCNVLT
jgi:hypothetical protein